MYKLIQVPMIKISVLNRGFICLFLGSIGIFSTILFFHQSPKLFNFIVMPVAVILAAIAFFLMVKGEQEKYGIR